MTNTLNLERAILHSAISNSYDTTRECVALDGLDVEVFSSVERRELADYINGYIARGLVGSGMFELLKDKITHGTLRREFIDVLAVTPLPRGLFAEYYAELKQIAACNKAEMKTKKILGGLNG